MTLKGVDIPFRLVRYLDEETDKEYAFLTNAPHIPAAALYRNRWQIELFFKWIKQTLKVKSFVGTSMNAVRTQRWIALCAYMPAAHLKFRLGLKQALFDIMRKLHTNLFAPRELLELFIPLKPKMPRDSGAIILLHFL